MTRMARIVVVVAATSLLACAHKPRRLVSDCREQIDDCMDECAQKHPKEHDSCFAGCRSISCEKG